MGHVKILTDHHPHAILNYHPALQKPFLKLQRGDPLDVEKKNLQIKFLSKPYDGIWSHDSKMV